MTGANTRLSPDPDWIEMLRRVSDEDETDALWPLLCDVAADSEDFHSMMHPGGKQQMADGSWQPCSGCDALAALREEVERDA